MGNIDSFNSKQNKIRHLKLVGHIVERLMPIGAEEDPEDVDEDSPSRVRQISLINEKVSSVTFFFVSHS